MPTLLTVFGIVVPLIVAAITWALNERSNRASQQHRRKEESYRKLILSLRGFYEDTNDKSLMQGFVEQVNLCWLYAPDNVISVAYDFLKAVAVETEASQNAKKEAIGKLILAIRQDLLGKRTQLTSETFRHITVKS